MPQSPQTAICLAVDPRNPSTVYAFSRVYGSAGLHKSIDGVHFNRLDFDESLRALAIDPASPDTIYVGGDHVYRSENGGRTFSEQPGTRSLVARIAALVVDPNRRDHVFAGSDEGFGFYLSAPEAPVMRSEDGGAHWMAAVAQENDANRAKFVQTLAVDSETGTVYAGAWEGAPDPYGYYKIGGSVLRSHDGGRTWASSMVDAEVNSVLGDPTRPGTVYAGTDRSVVWSEDDGQSWSYLGSGLPSGKVSSLAFDANTRILRAGTEAGVYAIAVPGGDCVASGSTLCLLGGRFRARLQALDSRSSRTAQGVAIRGGDRHGSFSLPGFTGDAALPEVFVKMIDPGRGAAPWVFYGGLTGLSYELTVTDTATDVTETYRNDGGNRFCGGVDATAFFDEDGGPWGYIHSGSWRSAVGTGEELSLLGERFSVTLSAFSSRHGRAEPGVAVAKTDRYGYFSLPGFTGDAAFPEVHLKMVDFRALTGDFALFHTGLTSLDYTLTVTDEVTGQVRTFEGPGNYCGEVASVPGAN
jgi:hypothetical protein